MLVCAGVCDWCCCLMLLFVVTFLLVLLVLVLVLGLLFVWLVGWLCDCSFARSCVCLVLFVVGVVVVGC